MTFLIQFVRIRRGARVVIRTVTVDAEDSHAALARAISCIGTRRWPVNTDALRVMNDGGRTLLDWNMPASDAQPSPSSPPVRAIAKLTGAISQASPSHPGTWTRVAGPTPTEEARLAVGQAISYAEDGPSEIWRGGYEIVSEGEPNAGEAQYTIRSAEETHDRVVQAHELREDLGARTRGQ